MSESDKPGKSPATKSQATRAVRAGLANAPRQSADQPRI
jgi:hypothetical protein